MLNVCLGYGLTQDGALKKYIALKRVTHSDFNFLQIFAIVMVIFYDETMMMSLLHNMSR